MTSGLSSTGSEIESTDDSRGLEFGQYRVVSTLGRGGMGVVYSALGGAPPTSVAIKTAGALDPTNLLALRREISALRRLSHPGVVRIIDDGVKDGVPWYAMELLEGHSFADLNHGLWGSFERSQSETRTPSPSEQAAFSQRLREGQSDWGQFEPSLRALNAGLRPVAAGSLHEVIELYLRLCEPLAHVHAHGVVHRDLNPRNVFVRPDRTPVLVDFGLWAQMSGGIGREQVEGGNYGLGSINYIAPEQILGRAVDARADLYALGCMLYESLTGSPPFLAASKSEILSRHLQQKPIAPSQLVSGLPVALDELILNLLAKVPEQRIGHAEDVAYVLASLIGDAPSTSIAHPSVGYLYRPRLAGRHETVAQLLDHWGRASAGNGELVLIAGESGIGKTAVINEFIQRIIELRQAVGARQQLSIVVGECMANAGDEGHAGGSTGRPFQPLRTLLQAISDHCTVNGRAAFDQILGARAAVLGAYEPSLAQLAAAHGVPELSVLPPSAARDRALSAISQTLTAFARVKPLLLVIDDLQWADDLTYALLESLKSSFFEELPLLILGTFRTEDASQRLLELSTTASAGTIRLGSIDERSVMHVVSDMLAMEEPPPELVQFVQRESGGNPFLVAEYLRVMLSEHVVTRRAGRWVIDARRIFSEVRHRSLPAPAAVQELVSRRLARLSRPTRLLIGSAAVVGRHFDPTIVRAVLEFEPAECEDALLEATLGEVVVALDRDTFTFTHDKIREAAYVGLSAEEARRLHHRTALTLEAHLRDSPQRLSRSGELAHHFARAGERLAAIRYLEAAGAEALSRSANGEAIAYLKEALQYAAERGESSGLRTARWLRQVGDALQGLGNLTDSVDYLSRAACALGLPAPTTNLGFARALLRGFLRQTAHRLLPSVYLGSRREQSEFLLEAARVYDRLQQVFYYQGEALPIVYAAVTTLNLSEMARPSPELVNAYANAHAVAGIIPARRLSAAFRDRAETTTHTVPDPAARTYFLLLAGGHHVGCGRWQQAEDFYREGIAIAQRIGFRRRWEELTGATAVMDYLRGRFDESMVHATNQYESAMRGDSQTQCWGLLSRAQALCAWDQNEDALKESTRAEILLTSLGRPERIWAFGVSALAALQCGRYELAAEKAMAAAQEVLAAPPVTFYCIEAHSATAEVWLALWGRELATSQGSSHERRTRALVRSLEPLARVFPAAAPRRWLYEGCYREIRMERARALQCYRRSLESALRLEMPFDQMRARLALESFQGGSGIDLVAARARAYAQSRGASARLEGAA